MIHELKTLTPYFDDVASGVKTFEVRRADRPFRVGDFLALNEVAEIENPEGTPLTYTGRCLLLRITYLLDNDEYVKPGFVIMSTVPCWIAVSGERFCRDLFDSKAGPEVYGGS